MKINNLGYLLKEGIRGIFLHGFMSFAAVCVTVACLLIVGSFSCVMENVNILVEDLNKTNEVLVIVDESLSESDAGSLGTMINKVDNVYQATMITRDEAYDRFIATQQNPESFAGVDPDDLRHRYSVILEDNTRIEETVAELENLPGVADTVADYVLAEFFSSIQYWLRIASIAVNFILLLVSLLIISNTVKLAMYDRRDEIAIMKMVGATNGFIRLPYVVQGLILGMIGAGIAFGAEWGLYDALAQQLASSTSVAAQLITLVPFKQLVWRLVPVFAGAGLFVGVVGSWTSIRKFMKN